MTTLFANPYDISATGFYFENADEFIEKMESSGIEEFSIEFIGGDDAQLFDSCGIHQGNLDTWFEDIEPLEDWQKATLFFLTGIRGYHLSDAMEKIDDVSLYQGELLEAATELFDECYAYQIPENIRFYIDYEKFARDCRLGGDMDEFEFGVHTWTCTNSACI